MMLCQNKLDCLTNNSFKYINVKYLSMIAFYIHVLMLKALVDGHGVFS